VSDRTTIAARQHNQNDLRIVLWP